MSIVDFVCHRDREVRRCRWVCDRRVWDSLDLLQWSDLTGAYDLGLLEK